MRLVLLTVLCDVFVCACPHKQACRQPQRVPADGSCSQDVGVHVHAGPMLAFSVGHAIMRLVLLIALCVVLCVPAHTSKQILGITSRDDASCICDLLVQSADEIRTHISPCSFKTCTTEGELRRPTSLPVKVPVLSKQAISVSAASFICPGYSTVMPLHLRRCTQTMIANIMTAGTPAGMAIATTSRNLKPAE